MKQNNFLHRLKYILTVVASINLILLFVFHYEMPNFLKHKLAKNTTTSSTLQTSAAETLTITFDSEEMTYSGKGNLNLTKGVTITDENGVEVKASLFSEIKDGSKKNLKTVQYIAEDSYGNTGSATRILHLKGYKGPSIQASTELPSIDDTELSSLTSIFKDSSALSADDGYGNDITSSIDVAYTVKDQSAKEVVLTFQVTNLFNDTASHTIILPLHRTKPLIVLSAESIHLNLGTAFLPASYVTSATDEDGNDISTGVYTEGDISTEAPGTYRIIYKLKDAQGNEADPVPLKITVD